MFPELYNYYLWLISGIYLNNFLMAQQLSFSPKKIYLNNQFRYIDKLSNNLDSYNQ